MMKRLIALLAGLALVGSLSVLALAQGPSSPPSSGGASTLIELDDVTAKQGDSTTVQMGSGSTTTGNALAYDANGNAVDSGVAPSGGSQPLDALDDVTITTPATGATLVKSGTDWIDGQLDLADVDAVTGELPAARIIGTIARDSETCDQGVCTVGTDDTLTLEGGTTVTALENDEVFVGTGAGTGTFVPLQNCDDTTGKLDWDGSVFACLTDDDIPESGDFGNATDLDAAGAINTGAVDQAELAPDIALAATDSLDFSAIDANAAGEGLILPQIATCAGTGIAVGAICYSTTGDELCVWDGSAYDCEPLGAGNESITLSGPVTGSGTTAITTVIGTDTVNTDQLDDGADNTPLNNEFLRVASDTNNIRYDPIATVQTDLQIVVGAITASSADNLTNKTLDNANTSIDLSAGVTVAGITDDDLIIGNTTPGTTLYTSIPECTNNVTEKLNYDATTHQFECNTDQGGTEVNALEATDPPNVLTNEVYVGENAAGTGVWIALQACSATQKIQYNDAAPNTFTCVSEDATQAELDAQDECSEITGCVVSAITASSGDTLTNKTLAASSNSIDLSAGVVVTDIADHDIIQGNGAGTTQYNSIPDCNTNNMLTYTRATDTWGCDADDGAGGGAPIGVQYVVGASDATLTAEKILTDGQGIDTVLSGGDAGAATIDLAYTDTLAGNPTFAAKECVFTIEGTSGGGFLCEGSTGANTNEQLLLFPALDGADTTSFIGVFDSDIGVRSLTSAELDQLENIGALTLTGTIWTALENLSNVNSGDNDEVDSVTDTDICQGDESGQVDCDISNLSGLNTALGGAGIITATTTDTFQNKTIANANNLLDLDGGVTLTGILDNQILMGNGSGTANYETVPDCADGTESLEWDQTAEAWECNTITGGSASNSFETWNTDLGTNPVADGSTDTIDIKSTIALAITGSEGPPDSAEFDFDYSNEMASLDIPMAVDECVFRVDAGGNGGGFVCEGSAANASEQEYFFPDVDAGDTQEYIVVTANSLGQVDDFTAATDLTTGGQLNTNSVSANELNAGGVQSELEAVLDHDSLQLSGLTVGQVYRAATATSAAWGQLNLADTDAVTGTLADARVPSELAYEDEANVFASAGIQSFSDPIQLEVGNDLFLEDADGSNTVAFGTQPRTTNILLDWNVATIAECNALDNTGKLTINTSGHIICANDVGGGGGSVWSDLTDPSTDLILAMDTDTTTFDWLVTTDVALDGFVFAMDYTDAGTTNERNIVTIRRDDSGGEDGDIDALLVIEHADTNDSIGAGIRFKDTGGGSVWSSGALDFTDMSGVVMKLNGSHFMTKANLELLVGGTLNDTEICTYDSAGNEFDCELGSTGTGDVVRLDAPTLTGITILGTGSTVPTPAINDLSTRIATTAFVQNETVGTGDLTGTMATGFDITGNVINKDEIATDIAFDATDSMSWASVDANAGGEGIILPQTAVCSGSGVDLGAICYGTTNDELCVWDGTAYDCQVLGASGGAPTTVDYVVATADATLTAELVAANGEGVRFNITPGNPGVFGVELDYANTLAGNHVLTQESCIFSTDGAGGGGLLCEGSTGGNAFEQLHLFPNTVTESVDVTDWFFVNDADLGVRAFTSAELDQLENIGTETITNTEWIALAALAGTNTGDNDQVGTVNDGDFCQGGSGNILDCDIGSTGSGTVVLNDGPGFAGTVQTVNLNIEGRLDIGSVVPFPGADTSPVVNLASYFATDGTSQTLVDFDTGVDGQVIFVESTDATIYACSGANDLDCGTTDITTAAGDTTMWLNVGGGTEGVWKLQSYMRQADDLGTDAGAGGGDVATDTIWDVLGDLAVGTGSDTAIRLAAGADDTMLLADSGEASGLKWGTPATVKTALALNNVTNDAQLPITGVVTSETECVTLNASASTRPSASLAELVVEEGTNFPYQVMNLDDTLDEIITWNYGLPANIVGTTATVRISWLTLACTATTADDVCWVWNGGGFQDDDAFDAGAFSGTEFFNQDKCTTVGDVHTTALTSWTHGYDVASPKDTEAVFSIQREQVADATCTGDDDDITGDVQLKSVQICYEVENVFSGEGG